MFVLVLGAAAFVAAARLERVSMLRPAGVATINDGDSITIAGERIRLRGIDAPELDQTCQKDGADYACGRQSLDALRALTDGRNVECIGWERDRYRRLLAVCGVGGKELNAAQVEAGWAVAYGQYEAEEGRARDAKVGLWGGSFDPPRDWRARYGSLLEGEHDLGARLINMLRELFRI
ncbi:MAG: thermonuclease family protein [Rhizobiaceae bacterium]